MKEFMKTTFNIAIGAIITWFCSWYYYDMAGKELTAETQRLRDLHRTTLLALQNLQNKNATFQLSPDEKGDYTRMNVEIKGLHVESTGRIGKGTATAEGSK